MSILYKNARFVLKRKPQIDVTTCNFKQHKNANTVHFVYYGKIRF